MGTNKQRKLAFEPAKETRAERCQRLLAGQLGHKLELASELGFEYTAATELARRTAGRRGRVGECRASTVLTGEE